jgi:hypothetical protein
MDERCDRAPNLQASPTALFGSWSAWATAAGEPIGTMRRFSTTLEARGFEKSRTRESKVFVGIRPKQSMASDWERE